MSDITFTLEDLDLSGEFENKESAIEAFHQKFISRELAVHDKDLKKHIYGKRMGELTTAMKREFDLDPSAVKESSFEDVIKMAKEKFENEIENLRSSSGGSSEELEKFKTMVEEWKGKAATKENEIIQLNRALEEKDTEWQTRIKTEKIQNNLNKLKSSLKMKELTPVERAGFDAAIGSFEWNLSEDGSLRAMKGGEPIQNEKKTGHLSAFDVVKNIAAENNLLVLDDSGKKKETGSTFVPPKTDNPKKGEVHPSVKNWQGQNARARSSY